MSQGITDTTSTAYIPQATIQHEEINKNGFFAFLVALGVLPSEAQRSMYEANELRADVSKLNADNLMTKLDNIYEEMTDENFTETNEKVLDCQQRITKERKNQELIMSVQMSDLAKAMKGSQGSAHSIANSMSKAFGASGRRIY